MTLQGFAPIENGPISASAQFETLPAELIQVSLIFEDNPCVVHRPIQQRDVDRLATVELDVGDAEGQISDDAGFAGQ